MSLGHHQAYGDGSSHLFLTSPSSAFLSLPMHESSLEKGEVNP